MNRRKNLDHRIETRSESHDFGVACVRIHTIGEQSGEHLTLRIIANLCASVSKKEGMTLRHHASQQCVLRQRTLTKKIQQTSEKGNIYATLT